MTPIRLPDTPLPVIAWLETLDPDAIAGECRSAVGCVLAKYLNFLGEPRAYVMPQHYSFADSRTNQHRLPKWATRFIAKSDFLHTAFAPITAREALAILTTIAEGEQE